MGRYNLAPLSYEALDSASSFSSDQCPEGFCAVAKNTLRILTIERLGETFNQQACIQIVYDGRFAAYQCCAGVTFKILPISTSTEATGGLSCTVLLHRNGLSRLHAFSGLGS